MTDTDNKPTDASEKPTPDVHGLVEEDLPPVSTRKWLLIALIVSALSLIPVVMLMLNPPETQKRSPKPAETNQQTPAQEQNKNSP